LHFYTRQWNRKDAKKRKEQKRESLRSGRAKPGKSSSEKEEAVDLAGYVQYEHQLLI
jgi:hypothetical protein